MCASETLQHTLGTIRGHMQGRTIIRFLSGNFFWFLSQEIDENFWRVFWYIFLVGWQGLSITEGSDIQEKYRPKFYNLQDMVRGCAKRLSST